MSSDLSASHTYSVQIRHLFISSGHNYFGRPKDGPGEHVTHDVSRVEARAGQGLVGDRYFGVAAHFEAQVTFLAWEVFEAALQEFARWDLSPIVARRNIVTQGVNLNQLIGHEFTLEFADSRVRFAGTKPCSPCAWMDVSIAPGTHQFLRGRGGLRARILSDGFLYRGDALLHTDVELDAATIVEPIARPRLP